MRTRGMKLRGGSPAPHLRHVCLPRISACGRAGARRESPDQGAAPKLRRDIDRLIRPSRHPIESAADDPRRTTAMPIYKNTPFVKYYASQALEKKGTTREKFEQLYKEAALARKELLIVAADVAQRFNGLKQVPDLKKENTAWEKTRRGKGPNADPSDADIAKLNDIARGSVIFYRFADIELAKEYFQNNYHGMVFDRFEDGEEESGYRDIKYLLQLDIIVDGKKKKHVCELQLHVTFTKAAYTMIHPIYEITRLAGKDGKGPVTVSADSVKELAPKLMATYRTAKIRHMGGIGTTNAFYNVIAKFFSDKDLSKPKTVAVLLTADDVKALRDMSPVINNAYYTQMQHASVMVNGQLMKAVDSDAQKHLAKIGTGAIKQKEMKSWNQATKNL
jgi:hypothetical protein